MADELLLSVPEDCPDDGSIYDGHYDCPNCGEPFIGDDWEYTHGGDAWGGSAWYVCPACEEQTVTVMY